MLAQHVTIINMTEALVRERKKWLRPRTDALPHSIHIQRPGYTTVLKGFEFGLRLNDSDVFAFYRLDCPTSLRAIVHQ